MLKKVLSKKQKTNVVSFSLFPFQGKSINELAERVALSRSIVVRVLIGMASREIAKWKNVSPQELQNYFLKVEAANTLDQFPELRESEVAKEIFSSLK